MREDRFLEYLITYYQKHNTINDISRDTVVEFKGAPLKIGEFLASIRKQHRLYLSGDSKCSSMSKTSIFRYQVLNGLNFEWEPARKNKKELEENDVVMIFIEEYYKKHKTLDNIPETFTIDEVEYSVKNFFAHIRANHKKYISGKNSKGSNSETALRRYQALDSMGFDFTPLETRQTAYEEEDPYMEFIEDYYKKNKTLEGLPKQITYKGKVLNIDNFITDRRSKHKEAFENENITPSALEKTRWARLDALSFDWEPSKTAHEELMNNDICMRYLKYHYAKHKTINNITAKQEVVFEGKKLKIGIFINDMRKKYQAYQTNPETIGVSTELMLKRYKELEELEFDFRPSESTISIAKIARANGLKVNKLRRYVQKFDGDIDKALKILKQAAKQGKAARKKAKDTPPSLSTIMQEFEIDMATLASQLNKPALRTNAPRQTLMFDEHTNLRQYCIDNGLNYTVIQKAIKLRMKGLSDEELPELINRCIIEYKTSTQQRPSTWIYSKYGNEILVSHLLTYLNLDSEAVLNDMSQNCIDLFEAIENNAFVRSSKQQYDYLEFAYRKIVKFQKLLSQTEKDKDIVAEMVEDEIAALQEEYKLTPAEVEVITTSYERYINAIEQYKLFNVGFEKDDEKRVAKIIEYGLDEDEIEEAFFMPLKFDQKALIGRDSELYRRRIILKNLTVSWDYMSDEEKESKKATHNLTSSELEFIETTRKTINETKQKVFKA